MLSGGEFWVKRGRQQRHGGIAGVTGQGKIKNETRGKKWQRRRGVDLVARPLGQGSWGISARDPR